MKRVVGITLFIVGFLTFMVSCKKKYPEVIGMYDLKYTLVYDLDNSGQAIEKF